MTATCLIALLGVLGTGLPSHHHELADDATAFDARSEQPVISADHHTHGIQLVEQAERVQANAPQVGAPAVTVAYVVMPASFRPATGHEASLRPRERAPPPGSPRAPPLV